MNEYFSLEFLSIKTKLLSITQYYNPFHLLIKFLKRHHCTNTLPYSNRNSNHLSTLKPGEEKFKKKKKEKERNSIYQRYRTHYLLLRRTRYHVSAKSRVSPSRVKKRQRREKKEKRKERKERKKEGGKKKYQSGARVSAPQEGNWPYPFSRF